MLLDMFFVGGDTTIVADMFDEIIIDINPLCTNVFYTCFVFDIRE